jgi:hypothetical protein
MYGYNVGVCMARGNSWYDLRYLQRTVTSYSDELRVPKT